MKQEHRDEKSIVTMVCMRERERNEEKSIKSNLLFYASMMQCTSTYYLLLVLCWPMAVSPSSNFYLSLFRCTVHPTTLLPPRLSVVVVIDNNNLILLVKHLVRRPKLLWSLCLATCALRLRMWRVCVCDILCALLICCALVSYDIFCLLFFCRCRRRRI